MKCMGLLLVCFLVGCAPVSTLEELEAQAYLTGNWSEVDKRERMIARRQARTGPSCPSGYISYCEKHVGDMRCACVSRESMTGILAAWR